MNAFLRRRSLLALTLLSGALLTGCGQMKTLKNPPEVGDGCGGCMAQNTDIALGLQQSALLSRPFEGTWEVKKNTLPKWLKLSTYSGRGGFDVRLLVDRTASLPISADQPELRGTFKVEWRGPWPNARLEQTTYTVSAQNYVLEGRVEAPAGPSLAVTAGEDVQLKASAAFGQMENQPAKATPARVMVKYSSEAVAQAVAQALERPAELPASQRHLQSFSLGQGDEVAGALADWEAVLGGGNGMAAPLALAEASVAVDVYGQAGPWLSVAVSNASAVAQALERGTALAALPSQPLRAQTVSDQPLALKLAEPVIPTDDYAPLQWAFRTLGYRSVWRDIERGGYTHPVTVAVIDSGVRYDHPDLAGALLGPDEGALDVLPQGNGDGDGVDHDPTDPDRNPSARVANSHGTHVSGIIAARWGEFDVPDTDWSRSGVVGAVYKAPVKVLPIRTIDARGNAPLDSVAYAVRYAAGLPVTIEGRRLTNPNPAGVINLSLGGQISAQEAQPLCEAVAEAKAKGSLVVAAAGNFGGTLPVYPAACVGAVAVGGVTLASPSAVQHADYSSAYDKVALAAPGGVGLSLTYYNGATFKGRPAPDRIISTDWNYALSEPLYSYQAGTSQAAPQVSALAALLLSKGITTGPEDTAQRMFATATDLGAAGRDPQYGHGMINPALALGAPAISAEAALTLWRENGGVYQPPIDGAGRFKAYLGAGDYLVQYGYDFNGNGIGGERGEPSTEASVHLDENQSKVALGLLRLPSLP